MPVDLFGLAADYKKINSVAKKYDLFVIENSAQAFGADYHGKKTCGLSDVASTSFYPAKPLGCYGDRGDDELFELMTPLRVHEQGLSGDKHDT